MGVEFAFQCSGVLQTDLPTWSNTYGIVLCGRRGTTEWFMRAPRDACPGAQTCMDSKVIRAGFGSGLICPRAQTCCAELRRLARLANSPGFKSFRCPRWRIKFSLERFSDPSCFCVRAQPLKNSAGRVPQAADGTCNKISQTRSCRSPRTV